MKKKILASFIFVSMLSLAAHTNKTFLMPRPQGVNLSLEYTTFNELCTRPLEESLGSNFQITGFYQSSINGKDIGQYFLVNNKSLIGLSGLPTNNDLQTNPPQPFDVDAFYIIHNAGAGGGIAVPNIGTTTLGLRPEQRSWGIRFDYYQNLDPLIKGLFFYANFPVVDVTSTAQVNALSNGTLDATSLVPNTDNNLQPILSSFFNGGFANIQANNAQVPLLYSKMGRDQNRRGVADIDIALGYKVMNRAAGYASLSLAVTIPTGNRPNGVLMFQPIVGNGGHCAIGGDLDLMGRVTGSEEQNIKLNFKIKYRYLLSATHRRTLGLKNVPIFSRYILLVKANQPLNPAGNPLIPTANVTTFDFDVTPGSLLDGIFGITYNNDNFCLDAGYTLYFKESEQIRMKGTFNDNMYAIAARDIDTTVSTIATPGGAPISNSSGFLVPSATPPAAASNIIDGGSEGFDQRISNADLDFDSAVTPTQLTNGLYFGLGYIFKEWEAPLMMALGAKYESAWSNAVLSQWCVYSKIGVGF